MFLLSSKRYGSLVTTISELVQWNRILIFYAAQQISALEDSPNYIRTLRFKLLYARTNAQSRALKGLPTTDEPHPEPSTWLAMHEFADAPNEDYVKVLNDGVNRAAEEAGWGETVIETFVWRLDRVHGEGKLFDD
jgi:hypothetical protein